MQSRGHFARACFKQARSRRLAWAADGLAVVAAAAAAAAVQGINARKAICKELI